MRDHIPGTLVGRSGWRLSLGLIVLLAIGGLVWMSARRRSVERLHANVQILEGVRRVCKLSTVEMTIADYGRRQVAKRIDLPFTQTPEAFLFWSGVASAGFDVCDEGARVEIDHRAGRVRVALPPPRILSLDLKRFEIINEHAGLLNAIAPEDRNRWYQEARRSLEDGAIAAGALARAERHARELFESFVGRWGYRLELAIAAQEGVRPSLPSVAGRDAP